MNIHDFYRPFFQYFRSRRMRRFADRFSLTAQTRVLDVGGSWFNWSLLPPEQRPALIILNVHRLPERNPGAQYLVADGCALPFTDGAFEIVYNNSVIEHLGAPARQRQFAAECVRVGRRYYVQTPNRRFPVEPHYIAVGIHWLPKALQRRAVRWLTLRGWIERPSQAQVDAMVDELRLLDARELRALFPGGELWRERLLGLTKALIVARSGGGQ